MEIAEWIASFVLGLGVGLASTFFGLGGGILIVPILPLVSDISTRGAIGTSLLTVFLVSSQNTWSFHRRSLVDWRVALTIGSFSALAAFFAGRMTAYISEFMLHLIFGSLLMALAFKTFHHVSQAKTAKEPPDAKSGRVLPSAFMGMASGLISGLTGVGGGVFLVPLLSIYGWVERQKIVATSVGTIVLTSAAGSLAFLSEEEAGTSSSILESIAGVVRFDLAAALFLGGVVSSRLGTPYQSRLSGKKRDWLLGLLLLALSIRILYSLLQSL